MRVLITNGYIVYYFNVVAFKTEIYDDDDDIACFQETALMSNLGSVSCM